MGTQRRVLAILKFVTTQRNHWNSLYLYGMVQGGDRITLPVLLLEAVTAAGMLKQWAMAVVKS